MREERGSVIVGWLTKITVALVLVGVVAFDFISVGSAKVSASDTAQHAARMGATAYRDTRDVQKAYAVALKYAEQHGGSIDPAKFVVESDGTVRVTVTKTAKSILFFRAGPTKKWTAVKGEGSAKPT